MVLPIKSLFSNEFEYRCVCISVVTFAYRHLKDGSLTQQMLRNANSCLFGRKLRFMKPINTLNKAENKSLEAACLIPLSPACKIHIFKTECGLVFH